VETFRRLSTTYAKITLQLRKSLRSENFLSYHLYVISMPEFLPAWNMRSASIPEL